MRYRHLEEGEQATLLEWASYIFVTANDGRSVCLHDLIVAIPNGAYLAGDEKQRGAQMGRLLALGLTPGAADVFVMLARGQWHGLFIEMKKRRKDFASAADARRAVSPLQRGFGELAQRMGFRYVVCYGFDEAKHAIESYVDGRDIVLEESVA